MLAPCAYINLTASGAVKASGGQLAGLVLTGGSDAATVILYDNTEGSGTIIAKLAAAAGVSVALPLALPVVFGKACYATITGTGPSVSAFYL